MRPRVEPGQFFRGNGGLPSVGKKILELGCGRTKAPGAIGVDSNRDATAADVICDLNQGLPFREHRFGQVPAVPVVEQLKQLMKQMAEIHRVTRPGGTIYL